LSVSIYRQSLTSVNYYGRLTTRTLRSSSVKRWSRSKLVSIHSQRNAGQTTDLILQSPWHCANTLSVPLPFFFRPFFSFFFG
jgi:hypothetical protein